MFIKHEKSILHLQVIKKKIYLRKIIMIKPRIGERQMNRER
jgi:hypothetical protein